ncbi:MAG: hypothetical protein PHR00_02270 [Patescibacteria group bacterium]|nr:hypothetical protein [Patescibacteria group bacterium]
MATKKLSKNPIQNTMIAKEFVSSEKNQYAYSLGNLIASSFSGFIAGLIVTCLIWIVVINVYFIS